MLPELLARDARQAPQSGDMSRLRSLFRGNERAEQPPAAAAIPQPMAEPMPAPPPQPETVALTIFTADGTRELETDGSMPRTTDLLNRTDDQLRIRESGGTDWEFVDVDELLVVVPPEQISDPAMRLHRPRQYVQVRIGPYRVDGAAHVPAGSQVTSFLIPQRHHFAPLTEVTIQHAASGEDYRVPVAIVNLRMAESLRKVAPASEGGSGPDTEPAAPA